MPGTRYSATFDRTYVEELPPPHSPVRFSIQSWQGANLPPNPPLNGSYKHHARTASNDSLDSSGTGASTSSGGSTGTGHSRQVSMEGSGDGNGSTRTVIKTPAANHNPLQFVKVGPVPLYKKAVEQIKLAKDVKVSKETTKEEEEQWQNNLDSWKSRRKKLSERAIQRVEDLKLLEQDDQVQRRSRGRTFSEIMEDRAQKPRGYNLAIYVENESQDLVEMSNSADDTTMDIFPDSSKEFEEDEEDSNSQVTDNNSKNHTASQPEQDHVSNIVVDYECPVYAKNGTLGEEQNVNSKDSSMACVEEDCNGCGIYTADSGLESFSSSQRAGDVQDSSSELSVDSSDRGMNEDETDGNLESQSGQLKDVTASQVWPQDLEQKEGYVQLNLGLWLMPDSKEKDFGFCVQSEESLFVVEKVKTDSASWEAGLRPKDQILAVNGEATVGRSHNSILFAIKQSIYNGHLDLMVLRSENAAEDSEEGFDCTSGEQPLKCSGNAVSAIKRKLQNRRSFDDTWHEPEQCRDNFRHRSKSESSRTWEEKSDLAMKKLPPPVPAKPKLSSVTVTNGSEPHSPIVRTISNEMRLCSSTAMKYALLSDNTTDISKEMREAEDELDEEFVVHSGSGDETEDLLTFCVEQDVECVMPRDTEKPKQSVVEDQLVKVHVEHNVELLPVSTFSEVHDLELSAEASECNPSLQAPSSLHHVEEDSGLHIIFESHPSKEVSVLVSSMVEQCAVTFVSEVEEVLPSLVSQIEQAPEDKVNLDSSQESTLQDESQESEWVREELSALCPEEPSLGLDSLLLSSSNTLHPDDLLLVDLDSGTTPMEPPKEKPPPPPPADSPDQIRKMNTFKRVKKDLCKRRSDFLGIDPGAEDIDIDVPPPPDLSEILKTELDLERQNRLWLEKERYLSSSSSHERTSSADSQVTDDDEIARREREIIDNLERTEKARTTCLSNTDDADVTTSEVADLLQSEEEERIARLKEERRRIEEERFQREELRMRTEEDRLFKEREEALRQMEEQNSVESSNVCPQPFAPLANPCPPLAAGRKETRPAILPKPNRLSRNRSEPLGQEIGIQKEALELERERLTREQQRLQREKEEYRLQVEMEQRKAMKLPMDASVGNDRLMNEKAKAASTLPGRDALIYASKNPQGLSEGSPNTSPVAEANGTLLSAGQGGEPQVDLLQGSQQMNKMALHFLGAAPKARIIQSEQWISQHEQASKRAIEPVPTRDRGYNQNHWLVQEAEMRRISEQNDRQRQHGDPRRHSASASLRPATQPPGMMGQLPRHISSTAPRPYQRPPPPPPPPPKPPHGMPAQVSQAEQPWNYRPIAPVGVTPRPSKDKATLGDLRKFHSESVLGVPTGWTMSPAEPQTENMFSVSGKERCSHCGEPLGRGGAMIIESMQLYYHMHCFCCCVCQAPLGNGLCGTDVRVRSHKLHCQNCYSNDEAGLKFSQV